MPQRGGAQQINVAASPSSVPVGGGPQAIFRQLAGLEEAAQSPETFGPALDRLRLAVDREIADIMTCNEWRFGSFYAREKLNKHNSLQRVLSDARRYGCKADVTVEGRRNLVRVLTRWLQGELGSGRNRGQLHHA